MRDELAPEALAGVLARLHATAVARGWGHHPSLLGVRQWEVEPDPVAGRRREMRVFDCPIHGEAWFEHPERVQGVLADTRAYLRTIEAPPVGPAEAQTIAWVLIYEDVAVDDGGAHRQIFCLDAVDVEGSLYQARTPVGEGAPGPLAVIAKPEPDTLPAQAGLLNLHDPERSWR